MAKGANNVSKKRSESSKPYDVSNSFVKQVANRVSNLLPQTSWLNRWLGPTTATDEGSNFLPNEGISLDDNVITGGQPPPTKRARIPLHQSFSADNFLVSRSTNVEENSKASLGCFQDDIEEAGPSGLSSFPRSRLVSSTPAPQSHAVPLSSHTAQLTPMANGDDRSDSGESTSGCSSLVPQGTRQSYSNETADFSAGAVRRASVDEKDFSNYLQHSRSIFPNRVAPGPSVNSSPSSRQGPSFNSNLYTLPFSTRSPSINKSFGSPFYPGPTAYGGASGSRKPRNGFFSPSEMLPVTKSIQVKPINRSDSSELSSVTARRILDTLDELSSPVRDARRVPLTTPQSRKRRATGSEPPSPGPPTGDLTIPTVPDLLRLHRRMKLQDSLESARLIASTHSPPVSSEYRLRLQEEANRHTNKMTSRRRNPEQDDSPPDIDLPNIALPITSLPKFDFMSPEPPKQGFKLGLASDLCVVVQDKPPSLPSPVPSTSSGETNPTLNRTQSPVVSSINFIPSCPSKVNTISPQTRLKEKPKVVEVNGPIERSGFGICVAGELKTGSVMDILGKTESSLSTRPLSKPFENTFKPPSDTWECNSCLIRNKVDVSQCSSCKAPRSSGRAPASRVVTTTAETPPPTPVTVSGAGGTRSTPPPLPAGPTPRVGAAWECATCMVRNPATAEFCAACEGVRPGSGGSLPVSSKPPAGFGSAFKKPEGSWDCPDCMVVNKEVAKCVACGASKPGAAKPAKPAAVSGFGDMFRLPEGSWECPDCMLVNKDVWKCVACEATKPGIPGFGDMFKKPEGSWECPDCMLSNKNVMKCVACEAPKPGTAKPSQPTPTIKFNFDIPPEASSFKFGVDKAGDSTNTTGGATASKPTSTVNFKFGATSSTGEVAGFTFGTPVTKNSSTADVPTGFSFGNGIAAVKTASNPDTSLPSPALFSFGVPTTEKKPQCNENGKITSSLATSNTIEAKKIVDSVPVNNVKAQVPFAFTPIKSDEQTKPTEPAPSFKFGAPTSSSLVGASSVKLNGPSIITPPTSTTTTTTTPAPVFGSGALPTTAPSTALFGATKPSPMFGGFSTNPTPSFGQASASSMTATFGAQGKSTPSFNFVSPSAVGQKRGCNDEEDRIPGGKKQAVGFASIASGNVFGSATVTTSLAASSTNAPVMSFGSSAKSSDVSFKTSVNPSFGSTFSSGNAEATEKAAPFVFGTGGGGNPPPAYSFSAKQESSVSASAPTFGFGVATPTTGGFNFSSHASEKPAGGFSFGPTPASFGNVSAVAPVFGGAPPPAYPGPSAGFNFGASAAQQTPTAGVFSFSANAPAPAFAFGQGATPASTFDPNARPTFNFTGGEIPQFTAAGASVQPSSGARRIKKAVRRTPR